MCRVWWCRERLKVEGVVCLTYLENAGVRKRQPGGSRTAHCLRGRGSSSQVPGIGLQLINNDRSHKCTRWSKKGPGGQDRYNCNMNQFLFSLLVFAIKLICILPLRKEWVFHLVRLLLAKSKIFQVYWSVDFVILSFFVCLSVYHLQVTIWNRSSWNFTKL